MTRQQFWDMVAVASIETRSFTDAPSEVAEVAALLADRLCELRDTRVEEDIARKEAVQAAIRKAEKRGTTGRG